jgi:hypothetical protein
MVFLTAGFFYNIHPGWNANSQVALTSAIVERGTVCIDAYHAAPDYETGDKAFFQGHYYCDKSPVTAFLGTGPLVLYRLATKLSGIERSVNAARYWTTWLTTGLCAALMAALTTLALIRRGTAPVTAARFGALWVVATPLLGYSTVFFSYAPACAMVLGGFLLAAPVWREGRRLSRRRLACAGALLGLAAWTLYTTALMTLILTAGLVAFGMPEGTAGERWRERWRRLWPWTLGGLAGVAGHFVYSYSIFHSFNLPYAYEAHPFFREQMARGLMGATRPRLMVALLLTLRPYQGLFVWFPLATAAGIGLIASLAEKERPADRREALMALLAFLAILTYNSAYSQWWGGWAYMPRHLIPALALLALGLLPWIISYPGKRLWMLVAVGIVGAVVSLSAVAFNPQHSIGMPDEILLDVRSVRYWPSTMPVVLRLFWIDGAMMNPNWGTMLGLKGQVSLLPLAAIWAAGWWLSKRIDWRVRRKP